MTKKIAKYVGVDVSTTALSVGVRGEEGDEDFLAIPMSGATRWHEQPSFDLEHLPIMFASVLSQLEDQGWRFDTPGNLSFSVRQHDMVLMDRKLQPLIPALSWECHVAEQEVRDLESIGVDQVVGPIAPRFILPKLIWTLREHPTLADQLHCVATTGDFISAKLTGNLRLSASDALSNSLLDQTTKKVASDAIRKTIVSPDWFPTVIPSGELVGTVLPRPDASPDWAPICNLLRDWSVAAGLGDNHAGAVGCGLADERTIVISGGSSGTVVRVCRPTEKLAGRANCFEFYDNRLLLMMLADCAIWYNRFLQERFEHAVDHGVLNKAAIDTDLSRIKRIKQTSRDGWWSEVYPNGFDDLGWPEQVASTQFSIALELLVLAKDLLVEVQDTEQPIHRFVLTGGLCQSPLIRSVLYTGLNSLAPAAAIRVSARSDKLAFQSATYGALINSILLGDTTSLSQTIDRLCPQRECESSADHPATGLSALIGEHLRP